MSAGASRRQQRIEELCAAVIRALSGEVALDYRGRRLYRNGRPVPATAAHLHAGPEADDPASCRGVVDGIALRVLHSDADLHRRLRPEGSLERMLFGLLEQLRVESLAPPAMPGLAANLHERFVRWSHAFHRSRLTEGRVGLVVYTLAQMSWSKLHAKPVLEETEEYIEGSRAKLVRRLGPHLAALRRVRHDQAAYAKHTKEIARTVAGMLRELVEQQGGDADDDADATLRENFALLLDDEGDEDGGEAPDLAAGAHGEASERTGLTYRIHTTRYDRELRAESLLRAALLREQREYLDRRIAALGFNSGRLARRLAAILSVPRSDGWRFGEEEGRIDGRRLAQIVSSPVERRIFTLEQRAPAADCNVSFLVDCSGSMRPFIEDIVVVIDLMVRALDRCGVVTEVLGFTTGSWNGGRARRDWIADGRPRYPGRLNELCHMISKDAEHSWRRARGGIAALLKGDLFREGIDGEAIDWACARMASRQEERRILIVVSDGCPMDSATSLANGDRYLDNHLQETVARHEALGEVDIRAIGIGRDPGAHYRRRLVVDLSQGIDDELFSDIVRLIGRPRGRGRTAPG